MTADMMELAIEEARTTISAPPPTQAARDMQQIAFIFSYLLIYALASVIGYHGTNYFTITLWL